MTLYDVNAWHDDDEDPIIVSIYATRINADGLVETIAGEPLASIVTDIDPAAYGDSWWQTDDPEMPADVAAVVTEWADGGAR